MAARPGLGDAHELRTLAGQLAREHIDVAVPGADGAEIHGLRAIVARDGVDFGPVPIEPEVVAERWKEISNNQRQRLMELG